MQENSLPLYEQIEVEVASRGFVHGQVDIDAMVEEIWEQHGITDLRAIPCLELDDALERHDSCNPENWADDAYERLMDAIAASTQARLEAESLIETAYDEMSGRL